eukprot:Nk52_evm36s156 gene=Nk52_evmTU36s156
MSSTKVEPIENPNSDRSPRKSRKCCIIATVVIIALVGAGAGIAAWQLTKSDDDDSSSGSGGTTNVDGQAADAPDGIKVQTTVTNMQVPKDVEVVSSSATTASARRRRSEGYPFSFDRAYNDAGTEYSNTVSRESIRVDALKEISQIETIMCYVNQLGNNYFPTHSGYKASINAALCEEANGGESNSQAFVTAFVKTSFTVLSHISYQFVEAYIELDGPQTVVAKLNITQGPGTTPEEKKKLPYGLFTLSWSMFMDGTTKKVGKGSLRAIYDKSINRTLLQLFDEEDQTVFGGRIKKSQVTVLKAQDGLSGTAQITKNDQQTSYDVKIGYSNDLVYVVDKPTIGKSCFNASDFRRETFGYMLFHSGNGTAVKAMSGFPFTKTNSTGKFYGYAQGEFASLQGGEQVQDGDVIVKEDFGKRDTNATGESITVNVKGGVLYSFTKTTENISAIANVELYSSQFQSQVQSDTECGFEAIVRYNTSLSTAAFQVVGCRTKQWQPKMFTPDKWVLATVKTGQFHFFMLDRNTMMFWKEGTTEVTFSTSSKVKPGSQTSDIEFLCASNCLVAEFSSSQDAYLKTSLPTQEVSTWIAYTYKASTDQLLDSNGKHVYLKSGVTANRHDWLSMGLFLKSETTGKTTQEEVLKAGVVEWRYNALEKSLIYSYANGTKLDLDKTVRFQYKHLTANDANGDSKYDQSRVNMEYNGPRQLHGIPYKEFGSGERKHYKPSFSIKAGTTMGKNQEYVCKPVYTDLRMTKVKVDVCQANTDLSGLENVSLSKLEAFQPVNGQLPGAFDITKPTGADDWASEVVDGLLANATVSAV